MHFFVNKIKMVKKVVGGYFGKFLPVVAVVEDLVVVEAVVEVVAKIMKIISMYAMDK